EMEVAVPVSVDRGVSKCEEAAVHGRKKPARPRLAAIGRRRVAREKTVHEREGPRRNLNERLVGGGVVSRHDPLPTLHQRRLALGVFHEGAEERKNLDVVEARIVHLHVATTALNLW